MLTIAVGNPTISTFLTCVLRDQYLSGWPLHNLYLRLGARNFPGEHRMTEEPSEQEQLHVICHGCFFYNSDLCVNLLFLSLKKTVGSLFGKKWKEISIFHNNAPEHYSQFFNFDRNEKFYKIVKSPGTAVLEWRRICNQR